MIQKFNYYKIYILNNFQLSYTIILFIQVDNNIGNYVNLSNNES